MTYPPAPWQMHGQLWLSLFRVPAGAHPDRPAGVYGVALVKYESPSPLTYAELLVARPVRTAGGRRVHITDIWVDSPDSRDGGRELWAIPKDLAGFSGQSSGGRVQRTQWQVSHQDRSLVSARFTDASSLAVRTPFAGSTWQRRSEDQRTGEEVVAHLKGSARSLPCRGHWDFDPAGPLGWLTGRRALASFRMRDFQMSFG